MLIYALPALAMAALLMLAPAPLAAPTRRRAAATLLMILLLSCLFSLLMIRLQSGTDSLNTARIVATTLVMLVAALVAAPLLERARVGGLVVASVGVGLLVTPLFLHGLLPALPANSGVALLYALLIVATLTGLGGSMQLPLGTERFTATGARRAVAANHTLLAVGWVAMAGLCALLGWTMLPPDAAMRPLPVLLSGITASVMQLLTTRADDALAKAGEGFAAGVVMTLLSPLPLEYAFVAGVVAGFFVMRGVAITTALRVDDAQNLTGALLVPALLGLLLPALAGVGDLGAAIVWIGASCGIGCALALILWPFVKLTIGLATR